MSGSRLSVFVIAGPTASGKSAYALRQAQARNGVIINADSIQLYDALPILTAQPSAADSEIASHRLYGILPPQESCSAQRWCDMALAEIRSLPADRLPIVIGGTGLYLKTLMEGLSPIPDVPSSIHAESIARQKKWGNPAFHTELARRDPEMARRLHPNDTQRLVRAWEVIEATGKSLAYWQSLSPVPPEDLSFETVAIIPPREILHQRCNSRFDAMKAKGVLEEVETLNEQIEAGAVPADAPVTKALGFEHLSAYLKGQITFEEAAEKTKAQTRQYAKRQVTWCRHQMPQARVLEDAGLE